MFKTRLLFGVCILLMFTALSAWLKLTIVSQKLAELDTRLAEQVTENALVNKELDDSILVIEVIKAENERLKASVIETVKVMQGREAARDLAKSATDSTNKIAAGIINNAATDVKKWASAPVPPELNQLLKQRTNCTNGHSDPNGLCPASP